MMGKRSEGKMVLVTRWILNFMLVSGVLVFVSLPFLLQYAGDHYAPITLCSVSHCISDQRGNGNYYCLLSKKDDWNRDTSELLRR